MGLATMTSHSICACIWILAAAAAHFPAHTEVRWVAIRSVGQRTFYTSPDSAGLSWMQAQDFCNLNGTAGLRLASLDKQAELAVITRYAAENGNLGFWLSATDFGSEGQFHWTKSGVAVQPNVQDGERTENCLAVQADGLMTDERCTVYGRPDLWALCEVAGEEPPPAGFECPGEGKYPDPEDCSMFHECVPYQDGFIDYEFTCPESTNYCAHLEQCGHPEDCTCAVPFQPLPPAASVKGVQNLSSENLVQLDYVGKVGTKEFYTYRPPAPYFNWIESMEFCHANGMMLARMETEAERSLFVGYLGVGGSSTYKYFWLSAVDFGTEDKYYWFGNGGTVNRPIYGNGGRHSNCLYLASTGPVYDWTCEYNRWATTYPLCQLDKD